MAGKRYSRRTGSGCGSAAFAPNTTFTAFSFVAVFYYVTKITPPNFKAKSEASSTISASSADGRGHSHTVSHAAVSNPLLLLVAVLRLAGVRRHL